MDRRDFLAGAATGAVVAGAAVYATTGKRPAPIETGTPDQPGAAPTVGKEAHVWRLVTSYPKNFPGGGTSAQEMADLIGAMSGGRLTIKLFAAGELVPAFEVFDAVREGTAECGHSAPYYWIAKNKSLPFFCAVPGGLTQIEHNAWMYYGGGQELWDEIYSGFGLLGFMSGNTGTQMGGWFKKEINSLDDFKGLKMRIPGLAAEVINRMGATAVNTPGGEIMPALESGVIDAAEWVGPWNDLAFGFYKIAKYYYGPGFHEGSTCTEFMVNRAAWDKLSPELQQIVRAASLTTNNRMPSEYFANNAISLPVLLNEHGVKLNNFPADVIKAMYLISDEVVAETALEGDINRRVYESWSDFRRKAMDYAPLSDYGFTRNRALAYGA
jgi:TRAP-type mannitol/chloroaromatic compound transport system substrate-binding protein